MNVDRPLEPFFYKYFAFHPLYTLTNSATTCKIRLQASKNREKCSSWSNVLYERVYLGGDWLIQFVGRDAYKQFWNFSKEEKESLATRLAVELPALRGKVGASQEEIASTVGISRQTYSAYENRTRPIPWSLYLALLFYFDYIPSTHYMIRQLELFPNELDECWLAGRVFIEEEQ